LGIHNLMTLTAGQLAPLAASAKTEIDRVIALPSPTVGEITAAQAEGFDDSNVSYATLRELLNAKHAGYDMGISTFDGLDTHIQVYVDNSSLLSADNLQLLRFITMPSRIRAVHEDNIQQYGSSQTITIPDYCYLIKVTYQAAGGRSGTSYAGTSNSKQSGGGGGGGGAVIDFEIAVTPGQELILTKGYSLVLGALTVEAGGQGADHGSYPAVGGIGGKVLWNGQEVDDGITCIAGTDGMNGSVANVPTRAVTSNGKIQGDGAGYTQTGSAAYYHGAGGGACASNDGEDKTEGYLASIDSRPSLLGAGASSPNPHYAANVGIDYVGRQQGGSFSPYVLINFVKQQA